MVVFLQVLGMGVLIVEKVEVILERRRGRMEEATCIQQIGSRGNEILLVLGLEGGILISIVFSGTRETQRIVPSEHIVEGI